MGLFGKKRSQGDRFPVERLSYLPMAVCLSIEGCIRKFKLDRDAVWGSRFVAGYLLGYPQYVDEIDERLGGAIRKMLFDNALGPEQGGEVFQAALAQLSLDDPQTQRGWGAGAPDGERFFKALENRQDAEGSSDSLEAMFEIGSVDLGQQV